MSKPKLFDATMRALFELGPAAWLEFLGIPVRDPSQVKVIDSNVSTVTAEADKVLWVDGEEPLIVHTEIAASRDVELPTRLHWYNTLLGRHHGAPVWSVAILLRPTADGPDLTGRHEKMVPGRGQNLWFRYEVIRVWLEPPERMLSGGLPLLPLAPVANVAVDQLPAVLNAVVVRLKNEATPELSGTLFTATGVLLGLRYRREQVEPLIKGVEGMDLGIRGIEESWFYQDILAKGKLAGIVEGKAEGIVEGKAEGIVEGRAEHARETLISLGAQRFGDPDPQVLARIVAIRDVDRLDFLLQKVLAATSWDELLAFLD